eukprot:m.727843 g.727843  ORF g.727843 m.727843 type:complete len:751 (+) comp23038_c0_seq11:413-2665(+)
MSASDGIISQDLLPLVHMVICEDGRRLHQQSMQRSALHEPIPPCCADQITYDFSLERNVLEDYEKRASDMHKKEQARSSRAGEIGTTNRKASPAEVSQSFDENKATRKNIQSAESATSRTLGGAIDGTPTSASSFMNFSNDGILIPTVVEHPRPKKAPSIIELYGDRPTQQSDTSAKTISSSWPGNNSSTASLDVGVTSPVPAQHLAASRAPSTHRGGVDNVAYVAVPPEARAATSDTANNHAAFDDASMTSAPTENMLMHFGDDHQSQADHRRHARDNTSNLLMLDSSDSDAHSDDSSSKNLRRNISLSQFETLHSYSTPFEAVTMDTLNDREELMRLLGGSGPVHGPSIDGNGGLSDEGNGGLSESNNGWSSTSPAAPDHPASPRANTDEAVQGGGKSSAIAHHQDIEHPWQDHNEGEMEESAYIREMIANYETQDSHETSPPDAAPPPVRATEVGAPLDPHTSHYAALLQRLGGLSLPPSDGTPVGARRTSSSSSGGGEHDVDGSARPPVWTAPPFHAQTRDVGATQSAGGDATVDPDTLKTGSVLGLYTDGQTWNPCQLTLTPRELIIRELSSVAGSAGRKTSRLLLSDVVEIGVDSVGTRDHPNSVTVRTPQSKCVFDPKNPQARDVWIRTIYGACSHHLTQMGFPLTAIEYASMTIGLHKEDELVNFLLTLQELHDDGHTMSSIELYGLGPNDDVAVAKKFLASSQQLVQMGFTEAAVQQSLRASKGDLEDALEALMQGEIGSS